MKITLVIFLALNIMSCRTDNSEDSQRPSLPAKPSEPWHLFGKNGINIRSAWEITEGNKDIRIAIIDHGFLPNHPAFTQGECRGKIEYFDFINGSSKSNYHGTQVSSLIKACKNNPLGLLGINQNAQLYWIDSYYEGDTILLTKELLRWTIGDSTICKDARFIRCLEPNNKPVHVVNLSFGTRYPKDKVHSSRRNLLSFISTINTAGKTLLVAAAGNEGQNADLHFPASATGIISAGQTDSNGMAVHNTNWGKSVEIMAPGVDIPVADQSGKIAVEGSSFAAPLVSGTLSLMRSVYPALDWKTAVYFLQTTATPMDCHAYCIAGKNSLQQKNCKQDCCNGSKQICTPGRLNAGVAVQMAKQANISGLPKVSLVDADKYWIDVDFIHPINPDTPILEGTFRIFNRGGAVGHYKITSPSDYINFNGSKELSIVLLAKENRESFKDIKIVVIPPDGDWRESAITIEKINVNDGYADQLVVYTGLKYSNK